MSDHIPTFADVCSAIAEGHIATAVDGPMYQVNALELRRYLYKFPSFASFSATRVQHSACPGEMSSWSDAGHSGSSVLSN